MHVQRERNNDIKIFLGIVQTHYGDINPQGETPTSYVRFLHLTGILSEANIGTILKYHKIFLMMNWYIYDINATDTVKNRSFTSKRCTKNVDVDLLLDAAEAVST